MYDIERYIKSDQNLKEYSHFEAELKKYQKEKRSIQWEVELLSLDYEAGKNYLLEKLKEAKVELNSINDKSDYLKETNDNYRRTLRDMSQDQGSKEEENQK